MVHNSQSHDSLDFMHLRSDTQHYLWNRNEIKLEHRMTRDIIRDIESHWDMKPCDQTVTFTPPTRQPTNAYQVVSEQRLSTVVDMCGGRDQGWRGRTGYFLNVILKMVGTISTHNSIKTPPFLGRQFRNPLPTRCEKVIFEGGVSFEHMRVEWVFPPRSALNL